MKLIHASIVLFTLQFIVFPPVEAVGRVPDGKFNSEKFQFDDLEEPLDLCSRTISCAGITYHPHDEEWDVYFHSFLPPLLNNSKKHDWITERSNKTFVLHPGRLESADALIEFNNVDPSTISLSQAEALCKNHRDCVAFSYPIRATKLDGFTEILFARSLTNITMDGDIADEWNTLLVNEESKAQKANADAMVYIEQLEDRPYNTCCQRVPSLEQANLPSIEDVERLDTLPRISCNISKEDFQAQYEFTRIPVILEGCEKDWPATTEWTFEKLTKRFAHDNITTWRTKRNNVPGEWDDELSWEEVAELRGHNNGVYIFDPLESTGKESILGDYVTPKPMEGTDYFADDFPPNWGARRWLCVGERGSGSDPHMDPFSTDAWNTLISGHKWWILFPKGVETSAVECDPFCSIPDPEAIDWYTSFGRNAARTTFADGAKPFHILQKPGETLYVPNGYIHSVMNLDETIAITANYGSPGNVLKVWEAAVRKGRIDHWVSMYEDKFSDEEREAVMQGDIWPPYLYAGVDPENEDLVQNYRQGVYDEAIITWDNEEDAQEEEEEDGGNERVEVNDEL